MADHQTFFGYIMLAISVILEFFLLVIREELIDFLKDRAKEALFFRFNWIVQKVRGTDSTEWLENFPHEVVGAEEPLSKIRRLLEHEDLKIIAIYGMGGVGKTTLLKKIHDEYLQTRSGRFDIVIFVTVSKVILVDSIQKKIGKELGFEDNFGRDTADRSTRLFNELHEKKFLLFLDDLWEKLDLAEVGIPRANNLRKGSKVVFTTRLSSVCDDMYASHSKVKVPSLSPEKSWELFCKSLVKRDDQWTDSTRTLAKAVAEECGGLPLALISVGRAMVNATWKWEWKYALESIRKLEEVNEEVLPLLKFSFDRLSEEKHKECLLYCSLFPEDHNIKVDELIEYWIGEGLLRSDNCSLDKAREEGLAAITYLKSMCLLEDGCEGRDSKVKLHDVVRQMALWITSSKCRTERVTFLVKSGKKLEIARQSKIWANATKVSLMYNDIKELPKRPECHNLRTLLLNKNRHLRYIPWKFFQSMPLLTVLDLSFTEIELLPPGIGSLLNLRFLNLSHTPIKSLPREIGRLEKLTILMLNGTDSLKEIPKEAILSLSSLRLLNMDPTVYEWRGRSKEDYGETRACFRDLTSLEQLEELHLKIIIQSGEDFSFLLYFCKLWSVVRKVDLRELTRIDWSGDFVDPKELRELDILDCLKPKHMKFPTNKFKRLEKLNLVRLSLETISWSNNRRGASFENLKILWISGCKSLKEIAWVKNLPCLRCLDLENCTEMEEIIKEEEIRQMVSERDSYFCRLTCLHLHDMPKLKTICKMVLVFPCLEYVTVPNCRSLKELPLGSDSAKNVKEIGGEKSWWAELEWDNTNISSKFNSYFVPRSWSWLDAVKNRGGRHSWGTCIYRD